MHRRTLLLALAVALAGCAKAPAAEEDEPPPRVEDLGDLPDLPEGRGEIAWTHRWDNRSGPAIFPPEPYGPFVTDATLAFSGSGQADALAANITTEAQTFLRIRPSSDGVWRLTVTHHHHGLTQDEADAKAQALSNQWSFTSNGTRLDMFVDTADIPPTSPGTQIEVYLIIDVPPEAALALHLETFVQPLRPPALSADVRGVCMEKLSLLVGGGSELRPTWEPVCQGVLRLEHRGGGLTEARLVDGGDAAFQGRAASAGSDVTVDLSRVEFSEDTPERKVFSTRDWANHTAPVSVWADGHGGPLRLIGCAQWGCPGGG